MDAETMPTENNRRRDLDLALIGNCTLGALIDPVGDIVWSCFPRFDGDPLFCALLSNDDTESQQGVYAIDLSDLDHSEQSYQEHTAILSTRLHDRRGGAIEIIDFAPRFEQFGRLFRPTMLVRRVRWLNGDPRIRIRLRPACNYGAARPGTTHGSHHIRYVTTDGLVLRLTTDASITAVLEERPFLLEDEITLFLGPDETVTEAPAQIGRRFYEETATYWRRWVRSLSIPFEWQDDVIRAAVTLKLSCFEDTGAIVAAMSSSIPEAPHSIRNWDYRYCWLRDAYFVVGALNRLGATRTMEEFVYYIINVAANAGGNHLQPVYRINGRSDLEEHTVPSLPGYRGMGPVRLGNDAYRQVQHDVYGAVVLAATQAFFDRRMDRPGDTALFQRLEALGEIAASVFDQPDAGLWEFRTSARVHTYSSVMCWVACDRLACIARRLDLPDRERYWRDCADRMHRTICERTWNQTRGAFVDSFDGHELDASLLLLHELGFLAADDPRFAATVEAIGRHLRRGDYLYRYVREDDFGKPETAFVICTFWYIDALHALGRIAEARDLFEQLLRCRNRHGLLSEDIDPNTAELWGNFPQTYSMVGIIKSAIRLSVPWEEAF